jgi:hypothetical protein
MNALLNTSDKKTDKQLATLGLNATLDHPRHGCRQVTKSVHCDVVHAAILGVAPITHSKVTALPVKIALPKQCVKQIQK